MKRSHSHVGSALTALPDAFKNAPKVLKSTLDGSHRLRIISVVDISKPASKPVDEIEEPEEEDIALQNRLNKSNARMFQLQLEDLTKNQIKALESEMIVSLSSVKKNWIITIEGPVEVRCGNIMLENKNVSKVEEGNGEDVIELDQVKRQDIETAQDVFDHQVKHEDIENVVKTIPTVDLDDDEFDDDDDDCIILE